MSEYNGYELFEDIEDVDLQARNRAVVLYNIYEDNKMSGSTATPRGVADMVSYMKEIPGHNRAAVMAKLHVLTSQQGNA